MAENLGKKDKVWIIDAEKLKNTEDIRQELKGQPLNLDYLAQINIIYKKLDGKEENEELEKIVKERNYVSRDIMEIGKNVTENYEQFTQKFKIEHLHMDEEIRYIVGGSGYFDVRGKQDEWVRILVEKGDFIILPEGIYHRFTTDTNDYIKTMRIFQAEPKWTAYNRPCDDNESRIRYLKSLA
ncbi:RmlC-like cupin domain [Pseudocohnilembus persalinus]|uniref:Acireductone dioxygenase n=1 Tax=Pseudocohnilembus persalinus TaxID=266149 RepID=A0A0V0QP90_PSEPJ|nr:RmlC-like cupin domain [Pseudocohnilembus persalinus]|eukprot:KRX03813.1 RmlC-like cupin domain [Pseudocohnilembus persalinus]